MTTDILPIPEALPSLFIGHGAPMVAIEPGDAGKAWAGLGRVLRAGLAVPQAIVILSPHWMTRKLTVTHSLNPPVIHDFYGFPEALYRLTYPSPGHPVLAERIQALFQGQNVDCLLDSKRGLDHGAWVPLRYLCPDADIPVLQLSMPYPHGPEYYFNLGAMLRTLAEEGILLVGSGSLTHNLSEFRGQPATQRADGYVIDFSRWIGARLRENDLPSLFKYRQLAPSALRAHPQDDHLMPLFFALGAANGPQAVPVHQGTTYGFLSMDCFAFGDTAGLIETGLRHHDG